MTANSATDSELRELYRELILDHARQPRHFGALADATHNAAGINPLCGDKLELSLCLDSSQTISAIQFEGRGCAISVASASLMTEAVAGRHRDDALQLFGEFTEQLTAEAPMTERELGRLAALQGVREFPSRVKCATLAWHALRTALTNDGKTATTE